MGPLDDNRTNGTPRDEPRTTEDDKLRKGQARLALKKLWLEAGQHIEAGEFDEARARLLELTNHELEFRVARDGEEYCVPHLPKAQATAG